MTWARLEKKWDYIKIKQKILRNVFKEAKASSEDIHIPILSKFKLQSIIKKDLLHGFDPLKVCTLK